MRKTFYFLKVIKTVIENVKKQYAISVYDYNNIRLVKDKDIVFLTSDQLFLETLLMEITGKYISCSSFKKSLDNKRNKF